MTVSPTSWIPTTQRLLAGLTRSGLRASVEAVWSLLYTARQACLHLALLPGLDDDLTLTGAALDLRDALEEIEWARPDLPGHALAVDLGPPRVEDAAACRAAIVELLSGAADLSGRIIGAGMAGPHAGALPRRAEWLIRRAKGAVEGGAP